MRKFLQWSLVTLVAITLMAVVVGQLLATTTGRAREASVAVLKDKLARLEAEHRGPEVDQASPTAGALVANVDDARERVEADALRARWISVLDKMQKLNEICRFSEEVWQTATRSIIDPEAPALGEESREELLTYQTCMAPGLDEMQTLRDLEPNLGALLDIDALKNDMYAYEGLWLLDAELEKMFWIDAALGDVAGVVDAFTSRYYLATYAFSGLNYYLSIGRTLEWHILKPAIENRVVDDVRWNRLREVLEIRRSQQHFLEQVRRDTASILEGFETWGEGPPSFSFSEAPVNYLRTWAYPRLTPALFNHDFDRFNRAMERLLDLAAKPYYEVKDDLAQFCEDFDVEPEINALKFTRTNMGWIYILGLSRHEFEQNARVQTSIDIIRFAILLEKHKRDSGSYPESLEIFAEALGGSLPVNPLMGDDYVYERTEDSFKLGFRQETVAELVALGVDPVTVTWWHDPLGYEDFDEHPAAENVTATENSQ